MRRRRSRTVTMTGRAIIMIGASAELEGAGREAAKGRAVSPVCRSGVGGGLAGPTRSRGRSILVYPRVRTWLSVPEERDGA
jgi:hypothetical protein